MKISQISAKIDLRLNKSASADFDNVWSYAKAEAFNKAINDWVRKQKNSKNDLQEGDEETSGKVDDLQILLKPTNLSFRDRGIYVQTEALPVDYLYFKRLTPYVDKNSCSSVAMRSYLREEANVDILLDLPSFNFEETFHTLIGNKIHLYHNKDFVVNKLILTYYRKPKVYDFKKLDAVVEFKDDICEILTDEACRILASDMESLIQKAAADQRAKETT